MVRFGESQRVLPAVDDGTVLEVYRCWPRGTSLRTVGRGATVL